MPEDNGDKGEKTFTQEEVNRINAKANKRIAELEKAIEAAPSQDALTELQAKIDALGDEADLKGKSQIEQLEHKYGKEIEKREKRIAEMQDKLDDVSGTLTATQDTLHADRLAAVFGEALDKNKVFRGARKDALRTLVSELSDVEDSDNGSVTATWGELIDESPGKIAEEFLRSREHFAEAPGGGGGTRRPTGGGIPQKLHELSDEALLELDAQQR